MRKTSTSLIAQIFFRSLKLIVRSAIKHLHWVLTSTAVSIALPTLNGSREASVVVLHCPSFWFSLNHVPTNNSWSPCMFPLVTRWFSRPTLQHYNTSRSSSGPGRALKYSHIVSTTLKVGWVQQQFDALRVHFWGSHIYNHEGRKIWSHSLFCSTAYWRVGEEQVLLGSFGTAEPTNLSHTDST